MSIFFVFVCEFDFSQDFPVWTPDHSDGPRAVSSAEGSVALDPSEDRHDGSAHQLVGHFLKEEQKHVDHRARLNRLAEPSRPRLFQVAHSCMKARRLKLLPKVLERLLRDLGVVELRGKDTDHGDWTGDGNRCRQKRQTRASARTPSAQSGQRL